MPIVIRPEAKMTCPHCRVSFKSEWDVIDLGTDPDGIWSLRQTQCTNCDRRIVVLRQYEEQRPSGLSSRQIRDAQPPPKLKAERMVWPRAVARKPVPVGVPNAVAEDFVEACTVLPDSLKASAALSRRCLQNLLIEKAKVKKKDLYDQIQEVLDSKELPSRLADDLHAVRVVGAFGAHPIKSRITGEIVEVEPGEAEWNLDVVEALFDFYYVEEERARKRREDINVKLKDAGKPPLP